MSNWVTRIARGRARPNRRPTTIHRPLHPIHDPVHGRQRDVFQDIGGRQRDMRRGDPHRRAVEIVERLVRHDRHDLGAPAAQPRILLDREQPVRARDRAEDRLGVERHQRAHVDNFAVDAVFRLELLRRRERARHHQRERQDGRVLARPRDRRGAERVDDLAVRHLALGRIERLVLEEDHRIGIAHRRRHQADHVARIRRRHDLEARNHHAPVLDALRMLRAEARARAVAGAHHQRALELAVRHVAALRKLVGDVVEAHREEIREHDLGDRLQAGHRRAHGGAQDRLLGDRRVAHAHRAELLEQPHRRLEHAAGAGHVLAEEHDVLVALHLLRDAAGDRIAIGQFRHAKPPSA